LIGLSQVQIADSLGITQGQVSRYIDDVRKAKAWMSKPAKERYEFLLRDIYDRAELVFSEAWHVYHDRQMLPEEKRLRSGLLRSIAACLTPMTHFVPDAEGRWLEEQMNEIRQAIYEKRQAHKVLPGGTRVPLEPARLNE